MHRLDRLAGLLTSLQTGRWKTSEQLASRYKISARTVYRDIRSLQEAGVPVISEAGKGYSIMEGYRLPPVMFTREEAVSLLTGEKLLQKQSSGQLKKDYHEAMEKVRAVLRGQDRDFVETLDRKLKVYHYPVQQHTLLHEQLFRALQEAIYRSQVLHISYYSPVTEESTQREVEPMGLIQMGHYWYLAAWCRLRNDYRSFRLDRVGKYAATGMFSSETGPHSMEACIQSFQRKQGGEKVVVFFHPDLVRYLGDQKFQYGWVQEKARDGGLEMTFLTDSLEQISRWLLSWGNKVSVVGPEELGKRMRVLVTELFEHHVSP